MNYGNVPIKPEGIHHFADTLGIVAKNIALALNSTLYKICSRPRPENLVCGDFVQSFLEG